MIYTIIFTPFCTSLITIKAMDILLLLRDKFFLVRLKHHYIVDSILQDKCPEHHIFDYSVHLLYLEYYENTL